jgi:hypothetical protein
MWTSQISQMYCFAHTHFSRAKVRYYHLCVECTCADTFTTNLAVTEMNETLWLSYWWRHPTQYCQFSLSWGMLAAVSKVVFPLFFTWKCRELTTVAGKGHHIFYSWMHGFIFHNSALDLVTRALDLYLERSTYNFMSARLIYRALDLYGDSQKEISRKYSLHDKLSARVISRTLEI